MCRHGWFWFCGVIHVDFGDSGSIILAGGAKVSHLDTTPWFETRGLGPSDLGAAQPCFWREWTFPATFFPPSAKVSAKSKRKNYNGNPVSEIFCLRDFLVFARFLSTCWSVG